MSNALVESTSTKIRLITRIAFGFHGPQPLIALAMLSLGGYKPTSPAADPRTSQESRLCTGRQCVGLLALENSGPARDLKVVEDQASHPAAGSSAP